MYKSFVPVPVGPQWGICPTFGSSGLYPYGDNLEKELQMNYVVLEAQPSCISLKIALKFDKEICIYLIFNLFVTCNNNTMKKENEELRILSVV